MFPRRLADVRLAVRRALLAGAGVLPPFRSASLVCDDRLMLGALMDRLSDVYGDRRLFDEPASRLSMTYREASALVADLAERIAAHASPGERVVVAMPNGYRFLLVCLAVCRAGAVAVPINARMSEAEIASVIEDSHARLVVHAIDELSGVRRASPRAPTGAMSPRDIAAIFYTSGTTGDPKGAELSHAALLAVPRLLGAYPSVLRRDEAVCGLPVAHVAGFTVLLLCAVAGVPVCYLPSFRPTDALDAIESRRATVFIGVPTMYRMMLEAGAEQRDLRSIRLWGSGADTMPADLLHRFKRLGASLSVPVLGAHLGEAIFVDGYGMVELSGGVAIKISLPLVDLPLVPLPGHSLRVVDDRDEEVKMGQVGELVVRGPGVLTGYHRKRDATDQALTSDGWLRTGDLARREPFGLISLAGRKKHVIKHGGYSVYAVQVEHRLEQHPGVAEAVVIGLPDLRMGEIPVALVRSRKESDLTILDIAAWARAQLAEYEVPKAFLLVDELPRTGTDKVRKEGLAELFEGIEIPGHVC